MKRYPVKAIFEMGMSEYDSTIAFMPLKEAQSFFNVPGAVHVLEVMLDDPDKVDAMRGAPARRSRSRHVAERLAAARRDLR